jgi:hypothetical protein
VHDLDRGRPRGGPHPTHERPHPGRLPTILEQVISDHPRGWDVRESSGQRDMPPAHRARSAPAIQLRFKRAAGFANDLDLLAEEVDPETGELLLNFR